MRQVLEQNLDRKNDNFLKIVIFKPIRVVLDKDVVVEVAHRNYNTKLALLLTRIAFEKSIRHIQFEIESKSVFG